VLAVVWAIFAIIGTTAGFLSVPGMS
jgi:hypothetical protein